MFEFLFIIALILYFFQTLVIVIGILKKFKRVSETKLPSVSVIVAVRDEEENIHDCIRSLNNLNYPDEKIEIIIIDDHSTDNTSEIVKNFISNKQKFKLLFVEKQIGKLSGKANAISNAIKEARGEIILTTDADCAVSPNWAKTIASYFTEDVAVVCGFTNQNENKLFGAMQSVDFIYLLAVASGLINLGKPLSCIGNNMSYRRDVYDEMGGYESLPFSVTEDSRLLIAIDKLKKYKILYPLDPEGLVTSKPCTDLKSLYLQKKRWGVGGLDTDFFGYGVMGIGFLLHICILLVPVFLSLNVLLFAFSKFILDYFLLFYVYHKLRLKLKLTHFLLFELYFILYVILLPFILLINRNVNWKGRDYESNN
ncbi:glycosyltransferase [Bacteroidota bacterium]